MAAVGLRGLAQVNVWAGDVVAARDWYERVLGVPAYFQRPDERQPLYVELRLGEHQFELGIVDARFHPGGPPPAPGGVIARWHVDDARFAAQALLAAGATEWEPVTVREAGFVTASVLDPFGNVLGLIQSPHYVAMLGRGSAEGI